MADLAYDRSNAVPELLPIFDHLKAEFGEEYEIWVRIEDFGRRISAGIVNPSNSVAATILLKHGLTVRRVEITAEEIKTIRDHLISHEGADLAL
jgi:hypothetical protein